jgi:hypothetical protein
MQKENGMTCPAAIVRRYKTREQVRGYLASRVFQHTLEDWRNGRWIGRVSRHDGGFWVDVWPPNAREGVTKEQRIPGFHDEDAAALRAYKRLSCVPER